MSDWFEDITKTLADEKLGRRQALKTIAGTVASAALITYLPSSALARVKKKRKCQGTPYICGNQQQACGKNSTCISLTDVDGSTRCGCNEYCSTAPSCSSDSGCAKGYFCSTDNSCTGCDTGLGICVQCCTKTCTLGSAHAGRTAAFV
jgi:hypothetical protein